MPTESYGSGTTPKIGDTERMLMVKELIAIKTVGAGGLYGVGSPEGVKTANPGTTYTQTDTGSFWTKLTGTGNTGWLELIA